VNKHLSRKFIAMACAGLSATLLQWFGKLDIAGSTYALVLLGTVGAYVTANVAETKVLGKKDV
jgi:hypothetical protein